MERKAAKASRINDQTTESSVIAITIIFMIITELIEIAVKYTKLALMLVVLVVFEEWFVFFFPFPSQLQ